MPQTGVKRNLINSAIGEIKLLTRQILKLMVRKFYAEVKSKDGKALSPNRPTGIGALSFRRFSIFRQGTYTKNLDF